MATSAYAYFGVVTAQTEGKPIPHDIAWDAEGRPATTPADALKGALRSFDRSYKVCLCQHLSAYLSNFCVRVQGSHISLMVELLAGAMTGAHMGEGKGLARCWGSTIIAIDPAVFGSLEQFQANANLMCERVKNAKTLPDHSEGDQIWLPGERGDSLEADNLASGTLDVSNEVYEALKDTARYFPK